MSHVGLFTKGAVIGFSIAAPVGPIGLLVIRRTLAGGRAIGLATGVGSALGDATYGAVVALGMTAVSKSLLEAQGWIAMIGGALLVWLGVSIARAKPVTETEPRSTHGASVAAALGSSYLLTLTSPVTMLIFVGLFASLGKAMTGDSAAGSSLIVLGVFIGSAMWWLILSTIVGALHRSVTPRMMRWINVSSGLLIAGFGVAAMVRQWRG